MKSEICSVSEEDSSDNQIFEKLKLYYHSDNAENEDDSLKSGKNNDLNIQ